MKAEINQENKAKFFAQYYGQNIQRAGDDPAYFETKPEYTAEDWYLELKSLSAITDEDAIEMGVINNWRRGVDFSIDVANYRNMAKFFDKGELGMNYETVDYLRSKGYALPFMGLSVEEMVQAGWIKLVK